MTDTEFSADAATISEFVTTLFHPGETILVRPVESWSESDRKHSRVDYNGMRWVLPSITQDAWQAILDRSDLENTNLFYGVAPRFGGNGEYDKAWQVRRVNTLWCDIDNATPDQVSQRITAAGLPQPTITINSGNGCHAYWLLNAPALIDDAGEPPAIKSEWHDIHGKRKRLEYFIDEHGERINLDDPTTGRDIKRAEPELSAKAVHLQDILQGIAAKIGGDHTHDLSRMLRLPGTWNRKDARNGAAPKPCRIVCNTGERYPLERFASLAEVAPNRELRHKIASAPLPSRKRLTGKRQDHLQQLVWNCGSVSPGERSEADYRLCCWSVEHGLTADEIWQRVADVGKFAERGRDYFDRTWTKAESVTRATVAEKSGHLQPGSDRPRRAGDPVEILLHTREYEINEEVIESLQEDDDLYQRSGQLVSVVCGAEPTSPVLRPDDAPRIASLQLATVRELISRHVQFYNEVETDDGIETVFKHVPDWCVRAVHARGQWKGIRRLRGIVNHPVLRPDGSILCQPGYDPQTELILHWPGDSLRLPSAPTLTDAQAAAGRLLDLVADFPFEAPEHRAAWLAFLLTPLARFAFPDAITCPLFLVDANVRGSGKTKAVDLGGVIVCGFELPRMVLPRDDDELRKHMLAIALAGDEMVLIDNVAGELGGQTLDAMLTGTRWKGRILKESRDAEVSLNTTFAATSNNASITGDLCRRTIHIRLLSPLERPEERADFKHPNILQYAKGHRSELLADALTILHAYCRAGRPDLHLTPMGSFQEWSDLVRQSVVWCGQPDPWDTRIELAKRADSNVHVLSDLLRGWPSVDEDGSGLTAAEVLQRLESAPAMYSTLRGSIGELCNCKPNTLPSPRLLGRKLGSIRDRIVGGQRLISVDNGHGVMVWRVDDAKPNPGYPGSSWFPANGPRTKTGNNPVTDTYYTDSYENQATGTSTNQLNPDDQPRPNLVDVPDMAADRPRMVRPDAPSLPPWVKREGANQ